MGMELIWCQEAVACLIFCRRLAELVPVKHDFKSGGSELNVTRHLSTLKFNNIIIENLILLSTT